MLTFNSAKREIQKDRNPDSVRRFFYEHGYSTQESPLKWISNGKEFLIYNHLIDGNLQNKAYVADAFDLEENGDLLTMEIDYIKHESQSYLYLVCDARNREFHLTDSKPILETEIATAIEIRVGHPYNTSKSELISYIGKVLYQKFRFFDLY